MNTQTKTFTFPVNSGRYNGGELQIVASHTDFGRRQQIDLDTISYRPNVHTPFSIVTDLVELLCKPLHAELIEAADELFKADLPDEDEYDDEDLETNPDYLQARAEWNAGIIHNPSIEQKLAWQKLK